MGMTIGILVVLFFVYLFVYYLFGKAADVWYNWKISFPERLCIGFFAYYACFQPVALCMILTRQKLHVLGRVWLVLLIILVAAALLALKKRGERFHFDVQVPDVDVKTAFFILALAIFCECVCGLLLGRSIGWDFAYYIGNMTTSVYTDTMYLYDGSSGLKVPYLDLRYALSGFYMNTAWISQMMGISPLLVQKYIVGVWDILLSNCVCYSFAVRVFQGERKKSAILTVIVILLTIFWDVYDTSAQFLMLRGYEAKSYCANVVLPMVIFLCYRIWGDPDRKQSYEELFLVSFASVAVSMSSILLVPAALFLMLLAQILTDVFHRKADSGKRIWTQVLKMCICLVPNACYLAVYFVYEMGWLRIAA